MLVNDRAGLLASPGLFNSKSWDFPITCLPLIPMLWNSVVIFLFFPFSTLLTSLYCKCILGIIFVKSFQDLFCCTFWISLSRSSSRFPSHYPHIWNSNHMESFMPHVIWNALSVLCTFVSLPLLIEPEKKLSFLFLQELAQMLPSLWILAQTPQRKKHFFSFYYTWCCLTVISFYFILFVCLFVFSCWIVNIWN